MISKDRYIFRIVLCNHELHQGIKDRDVELDCSQCSVYPQGECMLQREVGSPECACSPTYTFQHLKYNIIIDEN